MSTQPPSPGPPQVPAPPDDEPEALAPPPELRVAAWLWASSAVPGAVAANLGAAADGRVSSDDPFLLPLLVVTAVVVWGVRILLAVLMVRGTPRRGAIVRTLLLVFGLIGSLANDPQAWVLSGGAPLVVALVVLDVMLVGAAIAVMYRPPVNDHFRVARAGPGPEVRQYPQPAAGAPVTWPPPTNTMAVLALIFAFVFSPLGAVFGFVARHQIRRSGESGSGLAMAGIVVGVGYTVLMAGIFAFVAFQAAGG